LSCCTVGCSASPFPLMWSIRRGCVLPASSYICGRRTVPSFSSFVFPASEVVFYIVGYKSCLSQLIWRYLCGHYVYLSRGLTLRNMLCKKGILIDKHAVTCMGDCRRGLDWITGFTGHLGRHYK
jgi:hypothetical protein